MTPRAPRVAPKMRIEPRPRILAIDPGPEKSAILELVAGLPEQFGIYQNAAVLDLFKLANHMAKVTGFDPGVVVIEQIESFGMAVGREVFETVRWAGRFEEAAGPTPVVLMPRRAVKLHLCGSARAKDTNIRQALLDRYGGPSAVGTTKARGPLYGISKDVWSALAIAVTYADAAAAEKIGGAG